MTRVVDELVEHALRELADGSEQRRLWMASGGPEVSSFTECVSRLWDDSGLADALDRNTGAVYTPHIDASLRRLDEMLRRFDGNRSPGEILRDPDLEEVRRAAQHLLMELRKFGSDQEE